METLMKCGQGRHSMYTTRINEIVNNDVHLIAIKKFKKVVNEWSILLDRDDLTGKRAYALSLPLEKEFIKWDSWITKHGNQEVKDAKETIKMGFVQKVDERRFRHRPTLAKRISQE